MSEIKVTMPDTQLEFTGKLTVDQIKKVVTDFFYSAYAVHDIVSAKDVHKGLLKLVTIIGEYKDPVAAFGLAWKEFQDLDEDEAEELYALIVDLFDIEDDELEAKIEDLLYIPVLGFKEFKDAQAIVNKIQSINQDLAGFEKIKAYVELFSEEGLDQVWDTYEFFLKTFTAVSALFEKKK